MPKMKTNRSAAKRFSYTGGGKIRRRRMGKSHLLSSKTRERKRRLRKVATVAAADARRVRRLVPCS